jgi:hypothetical protein
MRRWLLIVLVLLGCSSPSEGTDDGGPDGSIDDVSVDVAFDGGGVVDAPADVHDAAATCDADIASDPTNCGRCNHDCLGGACYQGQCGPVTIASGLYNTGAIAVDGAKIYWGAAGAGIYDCPKSGCDGGAPELFAATSQPFAIALDSSDVYFIGQDSAIAVYDCPKSGCTKPTTLVSTIASDTYALAVDSTDVYIGSNGILRCARGGCGDAPATLVTASYGVTDLAIDTTTVYFPYFTFSAMLSCPKTGCALPTTLASSQPSASRVTAFGGEIFWIDRGATDTSGSLMRCTPSTCYAATQVTSGRLNPWAIAVDASGIYWVDLGTPAKQYSDSAVLMCPLSGCSGAPTVLASAASADGIALDDASVFWTEEVSGVGPVRRVVKP